MGQWPHFSVEKLIEALRPLGAPAAVVTVIGVCAFSVLTLGAPPLAVCVIALFAFATYVVAEERQFYWRERQAEIEFDRARQTETAEPAQRVSRRLEARKKPKSTPNAD